MRFSKTINLRFCIFIYCALALLNEQIYAETLVMGYKTVEKLPYIEKAPDNSGFYFELYNTAIKRMGHELQIVRLPKKKIMALMREGKVDFYPGLSFSQDNAAMMYFINTGVPGGHMGLSRQDFPDITQVNDLKGSTVIRSVGSTDFYADIPEIKSMVVPELTPTQAIIEIIGEKADFYRTTIPALDFYIKAHPKVLRLIKLHPNCCGGKKPFYLGFSKYSKHIQEEKNPAYDPLKPDSPENFPTRLVKGCLAYQLNEILREMERREEIGILYYKYFNSH